MSALAIGVTWSEDMNFLSTYGRNILAVVISVGITAFCFRVYNGIREDDRKQKEAPESAEPRKTSREPLN